MRLTDRRVVLVDGGPGRPPRRRATRPSARVRPGLAGPAYILVSCASVQTAAAIATKVFATFGPAGTGALRFLAAAAVLGGCIRPRVRARPAAFWGLVAGLGMSTAATNLFLYEAIARIPLGTAGTLVFLGPLALAIAATRRRVDIVWTAAAAIGVVLLTGASSDVSVLGVALALVAAASVAASILMARRLGAHAEGLDGLTLAIVAAAILTLPMSATAVVGHASAPALGAFVLVVVVGTLGVAIPYALEFSALRRVGVKTYGILLSLDPAIAGLAGLAFLGQRLDAPEMLGIALVMAASAGAISSATG